MDNTNENALSTMLEESVVFDVTVNNPGILHRLGILKKKREFVLRPICLGALMQISKKFLSMDSIVAGEITNDGEALRFGMQNIVQFSECFSEIIALAVQNSPKPPQKRLISFFTNNLTSQELSRVIGLIIQQMDVSNFLLCTIRTRGIVLMKESANPPSTSGKQSEA